MEVLKALALLCLLRNKILRLLLQYKEIAIRFIPISLSSGCGEQRACRIRASPISLSRRTLFVANYATKISGVPKKEGITTILWI
jgi:hypothetical protein